MKTLWSCDVKSKIYKIKCVKVPILDNGPVDWNGRCINFVEGSYYFTCSVKAQTDITFAETDLIIFNNAVLWGFALDVLDFNKYFEYVDEFFSQNTYKRHFNQVLKKYEITNITK